MRALVIGSKSLCLRLTERFVEMVPGSVCALVTFDDSTDSRSKHAELVALGARAGIPVHVAKNRADAEAILESEAPDVCFVLNWYWLFSDQCLQRVPRGFIGVHNSRLPRYRGSSPVVWQMINQEPEIGYSIFTLTNGTDEGPVWAQGAVPVASTTYVGDVLTALETAVAEVFEQLYPEILKGRAQAVPQPDLIPTYGAARLPDDGEIDFSWPAQRCYDFVRAQSRPYPGAFTFFQGERVTIWRADLVDTVYYGRPGQVVQIDAGRGITVICGDSRPLIITAVGWRGDDTTADRVVRTVKTRLPSPAPSA